MNVAGQIGCSLIEVALLIELGQDDARMVVLRVVYYLRSWLGLIFHAIEHFSTILRLSTLHRIGLNFVRSDRFHSSFSLIHSHYGHCICVIDAE